MKTRWIFPMFIFLAWIIAALIALPARAQNGDDPAPPAEPVKLIFIHHSTGENWLTDDYGNLGRELAANHYFVSDTNYGWGPESIGDRTDIINWREWFTGPNRDQFMQALFNESGQNSSYTRTFGDPGGENQIILFKSCFPNSALEGSPGDAPDSNEGYTVGHAKYVYNELLSYFITRPDKLFVVITAPPLQDRTYAENARAFNDWLVYDWLADNDYPYNNVAVFDFHAVLTDPDNHHRFNDGQIEHITGHGNTLYYDSDGDDHPNVAGSQKATAEFIPLLNIFYHRWMAGGPPEAPAAAPESAPTQEAQTPPEAGEQTPEEQAAPIAPPPLPAVDDQIDDFEGGAIPAGTNGWEAFWDEAAATRFACASTDEKAIGREQSLRIDFEVAANSWATCSLLYAENQDWSNATGIGFFYNASAPALLFNVIIYGGSPGALTTYQFTIETAPDSVANWIPVELSWDQILGADWEADAGNPIDPARISGVAFGFSTFPDTPNTGKLWIDSLHRLGVEPAAQTEETVEEPGTPEVAAPSEEETESPAAEPEAPSPLKRRLCPGSMALGVLAVLGVFWRKKTRRK